MGSEMQPIDYVVEQLWAPLLQDGRVRLGSGPSVAEGWRTAESYWLVPNASRARLLLPDGPRRVTYAATTNYRHLRIAKANVSRVAAGALAIAGIPLSPHRATLQVPVAPAGERPPLPVELLAEATGHERLYAAMGVRTAENRKATLYLVDERGRPVGYAKFGWNQVTDALVRNEATYLARLGGSPGATRAPALLAQIDYHGHPVIVTEPLPLDVSGTPTSVPPPTSSELFWLTPVVRVGPVASTRQFTELRTRLEALSTHPLVAPVAARGLQLANLLAALDRSLPITALWHGDMTPWNRARERSGQLWVWDWESAEDDVLAGLDAIHWAFSQRRLAAKQIADVTLAACVDDAAPHLAAAGMSRRDGAVVAALYVATVVARAGTIAEASGTWADALLSPEQLASLLEQADAMLARQS